MATAFNNHTGSHRPNRKARRARTTPATASVLPVPSPGVWPGGSGYARYVGRVGALAVALGLGAAVATGFGVGGVGVAWATEDGETQTGDAPDGGQPADPQDESNLNTNTPTGAPQPTGTNTPPSGPTNAPSVPQMQFDSSGGALYPADDEDKDADEKEGADVSGQQGLSLTPPLPNTPPAADPPPPASPADSKIVVPQTNPGLNAPPAPPIPPGVTLPDPSTDTLKIEDNPGTGSLAARAGGGGGTQALTMFSALAADPDPQGPQLLMAAAAAAPGTPAPAPLVDQPDNLFEAVLGAPVVLANIAVTAVTTLLSSILTPGPTTPAPPVMLFVVLGWVQRELQRTFFNQSPTAVVDNVSTSEDVDANIAVLANDTDPDINTGPNAFPGDVLTVTDYTQPALGSVVLNPNGTFTYTPGQGLDDGETATDSFTYTVSDEASPWHIHGLGGLFFGGGHTSTATVNVTVTGANDAPVAVDDVDETTEDDPVSGNVLDNDTDIDVEDLTVANPGTLIGAHGTLTLAEDGSYTYTPGLGRVTLDAAQVDQGTWTDAIYIDGDKPYVAFTFTPTTTGTYVIEQVNAPTDTTLFIYDGPFDATAQSTNLLDTDDDSGPGLTPRLTVDLTAGQTYTIVNSTYDTGEALGLPLSFTTNGPAEIAGITVDPATDPLVQGLDDGETLEDTFTYLATDGDDFDDATLTVTINGLNDAPDAVDDVAQTTEDDPVSGNVLDNDTDIDVEDLTVANPGTLIGAHGTLTLAEDGSYTYTPGLGRVTLDAAQVDQGTWTDAIYIDGDKPYVAFTFTPTTTGTYVIEQVNAPTDTTLFIYDGPFDATAQSTNLLDTDDDSGPGLTPRLTVDLTAGQTYTIVNSTYDTGEALGLPLSFTTNGPAEIAGITVDPATDPLVQGLDDGETLEDTFTYLATDGDDFDDATLTVTINGLNDAPDAVDDVAQTTEDDPVSGNVLDNDTDIDVEDLTVANPGTLIGAHGTLTLAEDGSYTYTPGLGRVTLDAAQVDQGTWTDAIYIDGDKPYVAFTFTPTTTGTYVIEQVNAPTDTTLFIYDGPFDATAQSTNLLDTDDDSGPGLTPRLTVDLTAGQTYTIVNSTYDTGEALGLPLSFTTNGPAEIAGITVDPATDPLVQGLDDGETLEDTFTYLATDGDDFDDATLTVTINGADELAPGFEGQTIDYTYLFPTISTVYETTPDVTVGPGVEFPNIIPNYFSDLGTVDISNDRVLVTYNQDVFWSSGSFNGFRIFDEFGTVSDIVGVTLLQNGGNPGLDATRISFDANNVYLNSQGLDFQTGDVVELGIQFA